MKIKLQIVRKDFNVEQNNRLKGALDEIKSGPKSRDRAWRDDLESQGMQPDENAGMLSDNTSLVDAERLVAQRDSNSGVPVVTLREKDELISSLRDFFRLSGLWSSFRSYPEHKWAIFIIGSLGRLGTAIKGKPF